MVGLLFNCGGRPGSTRSNKEFTRFLLQIRQETVGFATVRQSGKQVTSRWRSEAETDVV
jgi:hypothetical protein